ncbi:hypothetical protein KIPB_002538 [Kipferlia bialata]|uniref:RING-type E3 ubiquitin transferase n=1 Tax=Kipferlia bialata TaxID=797122 RepID=A0A9K3CSE9_9EUKA|nr:hypothetical protein KIPB_002538 [Kipferlia bialata]|eukprot:g2538.t1
MSDSDVLADTVDVTGAEREREVESERGVSESETSQSVEPVSETGNHGEEGVETDGKRDAVEEGEGEGEGEVVVETLADIDAEMDREREKKGERERVESAIECPVCLCTPTKPIVLKCGHLMCYDCLQDWWATQTANQCPLCRAVLDPESDVIPVYTGGASAEVPAQFSDELRQRRQRDLDRRMRTNGRNNNQRIRMMANGAMFGLGGAGFSLSFGAGGGGFQVRRHQTGIGGLGQMIGGMGQPQGAREQGGLGGEQDEEAFRREVRQRQRRTMLVILANILLVVLLSLASYLLPSDGAVLGPAQQEGGRRRVKVSPFGFGIVF